MAHPQSRTAFPVVVQAAQCKASLGILTDGPDHRKFLAMSTVVVMPKAVNKKKTLPLPFPSPAESALRSGKNNKPCQAAQRSQTALR